MKRKNKNAIEKYSDKNQIPENILKKIDENYYEHGMDAYNAVVMAFTKSRTNKFTLGQVDKIARDVRDKKLIDIIFKDGIRDIAARNYMSLQNVVKKCAERGGFVPGVDGAMKTISANVIIKNPSESLDLKEAHSRTKDFIDIPDNQTQYDYTKLACDILGYTGNSDDKGKDRDDRIQVNIIVGNTKEAMPYAVSVEKEETKETGKEITDEDI